MTELTARQQQVLDIVVAHIEEHGYPPTLRAIGNALGIRSTHGVHCHLVSLQRKGRIVIDPMLSRGIRVVGGPNAGQEASRLMRLEGAVAGVIAECDRPMLHDERERLRAAMLNAATRLLNAANPDGKVRVA